MNAKQISNQDCGPQPAKKPARKVALKNMRPALTLVKKVDLPRRGEFNFLKSGKG
jgi:hypothetical protein